MRHNFTTLGAAQLQRDFRAICSVVERFVPDGSAALSSLEEGVRLLNLPVEARGLAGDGGDESGSREKHDNGENGQNSQRRDVTLKEASDRVFTDNAAAKQLLDELDLVEITPANARQILQRRVENSD